MTGPVDDDRFAGKRLDGTVTLAVDEHVGPQHGTHAVDDDAFAAALRRSTYATPRRRQMQIRRVRAEGDGFVDPRAGKTVLPLFADAPTPNCFFFFVFSPARTADL